MWHLGTWVCVGLGSAGGAVGRDDFKGCFQPEQFCDTGFGLDELLTVEREGCVGVLILQGSGKGLTWLYTMVHVPLGM